MHTFRVIIYSIFRAFVRLYFRITGKYSWTNYTPKSKANLILTNHTTNWDFLYFGAALNCHMYFVASEHIFRAGFVSKAIRFLVDPIARKKGASAVGTTKEIIKRLRKGYNVCMMVEGNRSFSGETGFFSPNTAALAKRCGAGLIDFRINGGYFVNPRWSNTKRKGKVWGVVAGDYTAEELKQYTDGQLNEIIRKDLYVNAFEDQKEKNYSYKCKAPAETLETALFACPDCGSFASLDSRGDRVICRHCGSEHVFTEKGFFERPDGSAPAFETVLEWTRWQKGKLKEAIADPSVEVIRSDEGAQLYEVHPLEGKILTAEGTLKLTKTEFGVSGTENRTFAVNKIDSMAIVLMNTLLFTAEDKYWELRLPERASALHYMISYYYLNGREYEG